MSLKRSFALLATLALLAMMFSLSAVPAIGAETTTRLYVPSEYGTIEDALDEAENIPEDEEVEILVEPGEYPGSLEIDRPNTSLIGLSGPQHDADGFLTGFAAPVVVRNVDPIGPGDGVILITSSNVRIEGLEVVRTGGGSIPFDEYASTIQVRGHKTGSEEEILEDVLIRNNWLWADPGIAIGVQQANVDVIQNTSIDGGKYGVIAQGGDQTIGSTPRVGISHNHFENKDVAVWLIASVYEPGEGDSHGPASLEADLTGNKIEHSRESNTVAVFRASRGASPSSPARLYLQVRHNSLGKPSEHDLFTHGGGWTADQGAKPGKMVIVWVGNSRPGGPGESFTAEIGFSQFGLKEKYVRGSTILLSDPEDSFGEIELDEGAGMGNKFVRVP